MAENVDLNTHPRKEADNLAPPQDLPVKAHFTPYRSNFLNLVLPMLTMRYVWLAFEDINPGNLLMKPDPGKRPGFKPWVKPGPMEYMRRNFAALSIGGMALGAIALYSKRTYEDIKTLYAESVGYEFDKKTEDVTWRDLMRSHNAALGVTREAYLRRTTARTLAGASFFVPWHAFRDHPHGKPKYDANANAGVGILGTHSFVLEGMLRDPSFFDVEQNMVATTINRVDARNQDIIKPAHIQSLLKLQHKHLDKNHTFPAPNSQEGMNETALCIRIANLLNQTYDNVPKTEQAHFTMGKFNYLVGFGLLDSYPASLAFVELANRSADMKHVNAAAAAIGQGRDPQAVFQGFGIDMMELTKNHAPQLTTNPEQPMARFCDSVQSVRDKRPQAARTLQDFVAQGDGPRIMNH